MLKKVRSAFKEKTRCQKKGESSQNLHKNLSGLTDTTHLLFPPDLSNLQQHVLFFGEIKKDQGQY